MVITFTEEQKKQIESAGISVIQFKKMCYWLNDMFHKVWDELRKNPDLMELLKVLKNADA